MLKYTIPDKTVWPDSDPRKTMDEFDTDFFREHYNKRMSKEQPVIPKGQCIINAYDKILIQPIVDMPSPKRLLDIGCGNGRVSLYMVINGIIDNLVGIDMSDIMIEYATETAMLYETLSDKVVFIRSTIEDFPREQQFNVSMQMRLLNIYLT